MNHDHFDALTRRASLLALGAAGLAAFVSPTSNARDKRKRRKKKRKNDDATKLCQKQVEACASFIRDNCGGEDGCVDEIDCCPILANCSFDGFLFCFDAAIRSSALRPRS
jgi:hypothetical protein